LNPHAVKLKISGITIKIKANIHGTTGKIQGILNNSPVFYFMMAVRWMINFGWLAAGSYA
jgi:hypothetical protein